MGSKLDQDISDFCFHEVPTISICIILITNGQTKQTNNAYENNTSLAEVTIPYKSIPSAFEYKDFTGG